MRLEKGTRERKRETRESFRHIGNRQSDIQTKLLMDLQSYSLCHYGVFMTQKMEFLKTLNLIFFTFYQFGISEPHLNLLHWNCAWTFTFNISFYQEGCESMEYLTLTFTGDFRILFRSFNQKCIFSFLGRKFLNICFITLT